MLLRKLLGDLLRPLRQPISPIPAEPRRFVLVLMRSSIGRHLEVFREVVELVAAGLADLGYDSRTMINEFAPGGDHIVFCPHLLRAEDVERVPASTILYNFEPLNPPVFDSVGTFLLHYAPRFQVWDYSAANVDYLKDLGCKAQHVPLGYAPALNRIARSAEQDIDVLFYGDVSARRARVLDALRASGLNVVILLDVFGPERDAFIARAKVVLNIHNHDGIKALETPRVFYLLANRKAIVTEIKADVEIDEDLRHAMVGVPYDGLVQACIGLVGDPGRRAALEDAGFACMKARDEAAIIAAALGMSAPSRRI
jgi:hypothetical protein